MLCMRVLQRVGWKLHRAGSGTGAVFSTHLTYIKRKRLCFVQLYFPFPFPLSTVLIHQSHITFVGPVDVFDKSKLPCTSGSGIDTSTVANNAVISCSQVGRVYNVAL